MSKKHYSGESGSSKPAKVGAIINTVATIAFIPTFGILMGNLSADYKLLYEILAYVGLFVLLAEAVLGWIIYKRWMVTSAVWPYKCLMVMGFIPFGFITYLIAAKEWKKDYRYNYLGGKEQYFAELTARNRERERKKAAFKASPEGQRLADKNDKINLFTSDVKNLCQNGHWDYSKNVTSNPAIFDLEFDSVGFDERAKTIYIYFNSHINLYVSGLGLTVDELFKYRTKVEFDCREFCKGRATKFASLVYSEILPKYQKSSAGFYFSRFERVTSQIEFHVKK